MIVRESLGKTLRPFGHDDVALSKKLVPPQDIQLVRILEAVKIEMLEHQTAGIRVDQGVGRRTDRVGCIHTHPLGEALHESRLARAQRPMESDHQARPGSAANPPSQSPRLRCPTAQPYPLSS